MDLLELGLTKGCYYKEVATNSVTEVLQHEQLVPSQFLSIVCR